MLSPVQDPLCRLFARRPDLVATLLAGLGVRLPKHSIVRAALADPSITPAPDQIDAVLQLQWTPVLGIAVEVLRRVDEGLHLRWSAHVSSLRQREQCPVELLIVTPSGRVAAWAAEILAGRRGRPKVLHVPAILNEKRAMKDHQMVLLSAIAHAADPDEARALRIALLAQKAILAGVSREEVGWRFGILSECFPQSRRDKLVPPIVCPYSDERSRKHFTLGVAGRLLQYLEKHFGALPVGVTEHVLTLGLDDLARLKHRLATAQSLEEALAASPDILAHKQGSARQQIEELARARRARSQEQRQRSWFRR